jgi:hypothetical protein
LKRSAGNSHFIAVNAAMISDSLYFCWALATYSILAILLTRMYRRTEAERRINRGLRTYTTGGPRCRNRNAGPFLRRIPARLADIAIQYVN